VSWWQLDSIVKEQAAYEEFYRSQPPLACPLDGTPLLPCPPNSDNELFCPFDGWKYPRDWDPNSMSGM
jgi:hypothetical protein